MPTSAALKLSSAFTFMVVSIDMRKQRAGCPPLWSDRSARGGQTGDCRGEVAFDEGLRTVHRERETFLGQNGHEVLREVLIVLGRDRDRRFLAVENLRAELEGPDEELV